MGTRGLGHAVSYSVSTAPFPNGMRRMRCRGRDRGWFLYLERRNVFPLPLYKQGKQGQFPTFAILLLQSSEISAAPPFFPKLKESSAPPPIATGTTNAIDLSHHLRHGSEGTTEDLGGYPASLAAGRCNCPCTSSGY